MRLRYFSDLHLEFLTPNRLHSFLRNIPPGRNEVCIVAGDVGNPTQANYRTFIDFLRDNFQQSFVIAGNHEYYHATHRMDQTNHIMQEYFQSFDNVRFLHNECVQYRNHCFVGTTLWSHVGDPRHTINDIHNIPGLDVDQYNLLHRQSVEFLETSLACHDNCIVVTHHLPSYHLIDKQFKTLRYAPYNQWFASDLNPLMETHQSRIRAWFYGHTHKPSNRTLYGIPFLCNPIGYPGENTSEDINLERQFTIPEVR